jgi:predicted alpha/beta superfamily hydrolase
MALAVAALTLASPSMANTLPSCEAWLKNELPLGPGKFLSPAVIPEKLVTVDMEPVKAAGMTIEPSRRMRAKDYPWDHEIQVSLPPSYGKEPNRRYPVLWVTDGQIFFDLATALIASCGGKSVPEMIVVAVGPPPEAIKDAQLRRTFDFSPGGPSRRSGFGSSLYNARSDADKKKLDGKSPLKTGGAARFLSFIVDDVRPQLAKDYRMADDNTLFGHSGGGLFCGYSVVTKPAAFNRYVCGSAPFDAGDFQVFRLEEQYAQRNKDMPAKVFSASVSRRCCKGPGVWSARPRNSPKS